MKTTSKEPSSGHWLNRALNRFGFHLAKDKDPRYRLALIRFNENLFDCFPLIMEKLIASNTVATVLQIGANDGADGDPISDFLHAKKLRALLVEPQPEVAERLRKSHENNEFVEVAENAISSASGDLVLWQSELEFSNNYRLDRITSINRRHIENFLLSRNLPIKIKRLTVPALTVSDLLSKFNFSEPDVVVIDTEGHDKVILDQLDLENGKPKLIHFEISNLTGLELAECRERLVENDYIFTLTERDATCFHRDLVPPLLEPFKGE